MLGMPKTPLGCQSPPGWHYLPLLTWHCCNMLQFLQPVRWNRKKESPKNHTSNLAKIAHMKREWYFFDELVLNLILLILYYYVFVLITSIKFSKSSQQTSVLTNTHTHTHILFPFITVENTWFPLCRLPNASWGLWYSMLTLIRRMFCFLARKSRSEKNVPNIAGN